MYRFGNAEIGNSRRRGGAVRLPIFGDRRSLYVCLYLLLEGDRG